MFKGGSAILFLFVYNDVYCLKKKLISASIDVSGCQGHRAARVQDAGSVPLPQVAGFGTRQEAGVDYVGRWLADRAGQRGEKDPLDGRSPEARRRMQLPGDSFE